MNDPASPFDGVVTAEVAQPIKKVLAAQEKGAVGVIFVEDVHNQTGPPSNFQAQAANYWPDDRAARRALHAAKRGPTRCAFPSCRSRVPVAERLVAGAARIAARAGARRRKRAAA